LKLDSNEWFSIGKKLHNSQYDQSVIRHTICTEKRLPEPDKICNKPIIKVRTGKKKNTSFHAQIVGHTRSQSWTRSSTVNVLQDTVCSRPEKKHENGENKEVAKLNIILARGTWKACDVEIRSKILISLSDIW